MQNLVRESANCSHAWPTSAQLWHIRTMDARLEFLAMPKGFWPSFRQSWPPYHSLVLMATIGFQGRASVCIDSCRTSNKSLLPWLTFWRSEPISFCWATKSKAFHTDITDVEEKSLPMQCSRLCYVHVIWYIRSVWHLVSSARLDTASCLGQFVGTTPV